MSSYQPSGSCSVIAGIEFYSEVTAICLLSSHQRGAGAAERVEYQIALLREAFDRGQECCDRLLSRVDLPPAISTSWNWSSLVNLIEGADDEEEPVHGRADHRDTEAT
jgi:hypothetical protein